MIEVEPLHFARHVGRANHRERLAVELKVILVDAELWAGAQVVEIPNPEGGMVGPAYLAVHEQLSRDGVQSFRFRRWADNRMRERKSAGLGLAVDGASFTRNRKRDGRLLYRVRIPLNVK